MVRGGGDVDRKDVTRRSTTDVNQSAKKNASADFLRHNAGKIWAGGGAGVDVGAG